VTWRHDNLRAGWRLLQLPKAGCDNRDVDILNCPWLGAATCALAALLNLHPVFGQVAKARKAEGPIVGLPAGAVLVQIEPLPSSAHSNRMLALWMLNPQKHSRFARSIPAQNAREAITTRDRLAFRWLTRYPAK